MKPFILLLALLAPFAGCSGSDDILVKAASRILHITNTSEETLYYVAYPARLLAVVTVAPRCTDETALKPGETKRIPYETLLQTGEDDEAVVYWWRCDEGTTETTIGKAHLIRVGL